MLKKSSSCFLSLQKNYLCYLNVILQMNHKKYFLIGLVFVVVFSAIFALYFKRDQILWSVIEKKIEQFESRTSSDLVVRSFNMKNFNEMNVSGLVWLTSQQDTFATVNEVSVKFDWMGLLKFSARIDALEMEGVRIYPNDAYGNKRFPLFRNDSSFVTDKKISSSSKFSDFFQHYKDFLRLLPSTLSISDVLVYWYKDGDLTRMSFPETFLKNNQLESQVIYRVPNQAGILTEKSFILSGMIGDLSSEENFVKIYPGNSNSFPVRLSRGEEVLTFSFDTLSFSFQSDKDYENWIGECNLTSLNIDYSRLASQPVLLDTCDFKYKLKLNLEPYERVELDSSSLLTLNGFELFTYFLYEKKDSFPLIRVRAKNELFEAQRLFDAFPSSVFPHIGGIKTRGDLSYDFSFDLDFNQVDSVRLSSSLTKRNFEITSYGMVDFRDVAQPFTYHVYQDGIEETSFLVGPANPDFTPLQEISPYLRHSVLYSEDGLFYVHKGFLETAMNAAIAKDIQEKRFVRGGSTISMQLVKNLWLSKEKTLSRKLEEAMIVWMIENNRLLSKDRMFEIYLNIIEWGPHVYGIKQASHFYFSKEPMDLTPEEAIFMASVIPRPKKFMWFFDEQNDLKPFLTSYYDVLGDKLLRHNIISQKQRDGLTHNVVVTGAAKAYLRRAVSALEEAANGGVDDESELINVLDKAMNNEDIPNRPNKTN